MSRSTAIAALVASGALLFFAQPVEGRTGQYVLPPDVEKAFQGVIDDANEHHDLGDAISIAGVWVEADSVRLELHDATSSGTLALSLVRPGESDQHWARYFAYRPAPRPPAPDFVAAIARLGPLLDAHLSTDPWRIQEESSTPRTHDHPAFVVQTRQVEVRRNVAGQPVVATSAIAGALSLLSLIVLTLATPRDRDTWITDGTGRAPPSRRRSGARRP